MERQPGGYEVEIHAGQRQRPLVSGELPTGFQISSQETWDVQKGFFLPRPLFILSPLNCHFCQESSGELLPAAPLITITRNNPAVMSSKLLLPVVKEQVSPTARRPASRLHFGKKRQKHGGRAPRKPLCFQRHSPRRFYKLNKNKVCVRHCYHQNVAIVGGKQATDCVKL